MRFVAAPEYPVFPTRERPLKPYEAVVLATAADAPRTSRELAPDVVVHDILTLAPALAAELEGVPVATLVPHLYPVGAPGSRRTRSARGCRAPRAGRALWRALRPPGRGGADAGAGTSSTTPARQLGLPPGAAPARRASASGCASSARFRSSSTRGLARARRTSSARCCGSRRTRDVEPPPGDEPLVLVAPSTAQDPEHRLLRAALRGLAREPVRVLATWNRRPLARAAGGARQRAAGRVDLLLADDARLRAGDLPRRPRDARARARVAAPGRRGPALGRHGRERRAGRLGRRRRPAAVAAADAGDAAPRGAARAGAIARPARRAQELAAWAAAHDGAHARRRAGRGAGRDGSVAVVARARARTRSAQRSPLSTTSTGSP